MAVEIYTRKGSPFYYFKAPVLDKRGVVIYYERGSTKRRDRGEARRVAQSKIREILDRSQHGEKSDPLLLTFLDECLEASRSKPDVKNQRVFRNWLAPELTKRSTRVSQLDKTFLVQRRREFAVDHSESTCNNMITYLVSIYHQADNLGLAVPEDQSFDGLKVAVKHKTRYLMAGEEQLLLEQLDPHRRCRGSAGASPLLRQQLQDQYDLVVILIDTGLRATELTDGLWTSVDIRNFEYLNFYREKVGNEGHLVCTDRVKEILRRRWDRFGNSPYIFPSADDPTVPRGYAPKGINRAIERAGLNADHMVNRYGRFTAMHCFRHTFASRLVQAGMSLYAVAGLLGHTDIKMTQRYAHLAPQADAQRAADILNGVER